MSSKVSFRPLSLEVPVHIPSPVPVERIHADEENLLEVVPRNSQEAIVSCLSLHWVNDLPGRYTPTYHMLLRYDYEEQGFLCK